MVKQGVARAFSSTASNRNQLSIRSSAVFARSRLELEQPGAAPEGPRQRRRIESKNDQDATHFPFIIEKEPSSAQSSSRKMEGDASPGTPGGIQRPASPPSASSGPVTLDGSHSFVHVSMLMPYLLPALDKDREMQLMSLYDKFKNKEINQNDFKRMVSQMVGKRLFQMATDKAVERQQAKSQSSLNPRSNSVGKQPPSQYSSKKLSVSPCNGQESLKGDSMHQFQTLAPEVQLKTDDSPATQDNNSPKFKETVSQSEAHSVRPRQVVVKPVKDPSMMSSYQANNQQKQHFHLPSTSFSMKDGTGISDHISQAYTGANATSCPASLDAQAHDSRLDKDPNSQGMLSSQIQMHPETPASKPLVAARDVKTSAKQPSVSLKKRFNSGGASPSPLSKKQKVSGAPLDQSIEELYDVIVLSSVRLQEEEEKLLLAFRNRSCSSEATKRADHEEQGLILVKGPLRKKIADIMRNFGIEHTGSDVECCLSLCVEERLRRLISTMIRQSKQRVDLEKLRHGNGILRTSDIRHQILVMNRKAKEDWDKKQADESEKQHRVNESEKNQGPGTLQEKVEERLKSLKASKEEDEKMRTMAANSAARAAVGGDDLLSKWQLMAEQARQKRHGGIDGVSLSAAHFAREMHGGRPLSTSDNPHRDDNQGIGSRGSSAAAIVRLIAKSCRSLPAEFPMKLVRTISVKDVITVLEREPQMSKSALLYRLYEEQSTNTTDSLHKLPI